MSERDRRQIPANPLTAHAVETQTGSDEEKESEQSGHSRQVRLTVGSLLLLRQREQLLTVNRHVARRLNAQADLASINVNDRDTDVISDENLLAQFPTENEHGRVPPLCVTRP
jgi:hypothetical protein